MTRYIARRLIHSIFIIWGCATLVFFLIRFLTGDLGASIASGEKVTDAIKTGLPKTLSLAALSFLIAITIAVPTGILAALRRNTWVDYLASLIAFVGVSMPS